MALARDKVNIAVSIDQDVKKLLEEYSKERDLTLSKFSRNLIYIALDDFKIMRMTGAIAIAKTFRDILEKIPFYSDKLNSKIEKQANRSVDISVIVDAEVKRQLDAYSQEIGLPQKIFARNLIYVAMDDYKLLKKAGIVKLAVSFKSFMEAFQKFDDQEFRNRGRLN